LRFRALSTALNTIWGSLDCPKYCLGQSRPSNTGLRTHGRKASIEHARDWRVLKTAWRVLPIVWRVFASRLKSFANRLEGFANRLEGCVNCTLAEACVPMLPYLAQGDFKVVLQKLTPPQIREPILYYYLYKE